MLSFPISYGFFTKKLMNIHEYANELICIFEYHMKGQCLSFHLIPILLVYNEHKLRLWLIYYVYCHNSVCIMGSLTFKALLKFNNHIGHTNINLVWGFLQGIVHFGR